MTKAPLGGAASGTNPTDRGKRGPKRSTLCEGQGLPLAVVVAEASVPDMKLTAPTLNALIMSAPTGPAPLCLDKGYDYDPSRYAATVRGYTLHLRTRGEERLDAAARDPLRRPRRWVVERLHSWLNRSRRLLVRWEKLAHTDTAFVHLACALLCFQQCDRIKATLVSE